VRILVGDVPALLLGRAAAHRIPVAALPLAAAGLLALLALLSIVAWPGAPGVRTLPV